MKYPGLPQVLPSVSAPARLGRVLVALALAVVVAAPSAASPAPVKAVTCSPYTSTVIPPSTINVYRYIKGVVETVDFKTYTEVVMAAEWPSGWPSEVLRAGAVAVKQYTWYKALHPRVNKAGNCFDVYDDSDDQIYTPEHYAPSTSQIQAVETTWPESLTKNGSFFSTGYRPDYPPMVCGTDKNGSILYQQSARLCAIDGMTGEEILAVYYYPNLVIQNAPEKPGPPLSVGATPGDESAEVTWQPPESDGNAAITGYTVTSSPDGQTCVTNGATTCVVGGLANGTAYTFTVTATNLAGTGPASDPSPAVTPAPVPGQTYTPIDPVRLVDTRIGRGVDSKLAAGVPSTFAVAGQLGIPEDATAITGNLTVTGSTFGWAVYLGPLAISNPTTSTVNFSTGEVTSNGFTVSLADDGTLSATYLSNPGNTTDMVLDVTGYYTPATTGATYHPMTPARLLDSRYGNGLSGKFQANVPREFQVAGREGIPEDATAVSGNLTITNPTFGWAAYLGPEQLTSPTTSTINFVANQTKANNLLVALTDSGSLWATFMSIGGCTADFVFDVTGYFTADDTGATYVPIVPARLVDSRVANGLPAKVAVGTPGTFQVSHRGGVPGRAVAVTGNVTVVNQTFLWAVYVGPESSSPPSTSTVNFVKGEVKANGLAVALADDGTLSAWYLSNTGNTTDLVFDVTGYFEMPTSS
jgi:hypothetical protein